MDHVWIMWDLMRIIGIFSLWNGMGFGYFFFIFFFLLFFLLGGGLIRNSRDAVIITCINFCL